MTCIEKILYRIGIKQKLQLPSHGRFVLNTYSNKNKWLDTVRRVTNGNNKQKQIVSNEWHGIPGIRNKELRLEQIYRGFHREDWLSLHWSHQMQIPAGGRDIDVSHVLHHLVRTGLRFVDARALQ